MEKQTSDTTILTALTLISIFLMGLLDSYTYISHNVFVSAQTGNIIISSFRLFEKDWHQVTLMLLSFFGFSVGVFVATGLQKKQYKKKRGLYNLVLINQLIFLLIFALFQNYLIDFLLIGLLGALGGINLVVFNQVHHTTVNSGIMTGNTKNLVSNLYVALFDKSIQALQSVLALFVTIFCFVTGVGIGTLISNQNKLFILWTCWVITLLAVIALHIYERKYATEL